MAGNILIYGSYGYTGSLIAAEALRRGLRPMLAGRDAAKLRRQAETLGLEARSCSLDDLDALADCLDGKALVLHCAGPFAQTASPLVEACLRTGTHYIDITGEISVFEALAIKDREAKAAGIMLLPGAGFDVVPSDCLAAHLKQRLPSAVKLSLAFLGLGRSSQGTLRTGLEGLSRGGRARRDGQITPVPAAWKTRTVVFEREPVSVTTIPWGDVSTAYYSTGIPNIEVYIALPPTLIRLYKASRYFSPLLGSGPARWLAEGYIRSQPAGPSAEERSRGHTLLWGEVRDSAGNVRVSRLRTPEAYSLTADTAVAIAEKVLDGQAPPGFQTPSLAYGADFILEFGGVNRTDEPG
jgi:short subunit dehydrogenase-like uncharacterized protein